ncbi:MAG: 4Fe-4S binding protein [Pirellulales bacterium]|nr:4Fe-4S binding protein [Pirellulales bacterium]
MSHPKSTIRKKPPKQLAVIDVDRCTGCEACIEVCPVDCIDRIRPDAGATSFQRFCEINWDRCIGCKLCIRLPAKKSNPYELLVCPWDAISMVPAADLPEAVARIGGPPHYAAEHRPRLEAMARRQAESLPGSSALPG